MDTLTSLGKARRGSVLLFVVGVERPDLDFFFCSSALARVPPGDDGRLMVAGVPGTVPGRDITAAWRRQEREREREIERERERDEVI